MAEFVCPRCDEMIELLGDAPGQAHELPQCDCGAMMDPIEIQQDRDRLFAYTRSAGVLEFRGG